jgi:SdpC family antimicrobial peptide
MKLITTLLTILLLASCNNDSSSNLTNSSDKADNGISGKEYFRGIVLGYGEIAEQLPEVNDYLKISLYVTDEEAYKAITSFNDGILEKMNEVNPSFFAQFKKDMESGNHITVQNSIKVGSELFNDSRTKAITELSDSREKYTPLPPFIAPINASTFRFVNLTFLIQNNVIRFNTFNDAPSTFFIKLNDMKFRTLLKDQLINSVTEQF